MDSLFNKLENFFGGSANKTDDSAGGKAGHETTTQAGSTQAGNNTKSLNEFSDEYTVETEAGAIAGLIFGILVVIVMVVLFLFMLKRKRENDREYQKQIRIQKSTKQNAGVYMDTTMTQDLVSPRELKGATAYASLSPAHKDLYEDDSEDEI